MYFNVHFPQIKKKSDITGKVLRETGNNTESRRLDFTRNKTENISVMALKHYASIQI